MNRLKFVVFALLALGLWAAHLTLISPVVASNAAELGNGRVAGAAAAVGQRLEVQRSELQGAVLKLASSPALANPGPKPGAKPEAPTADRLNAIRTALTEGLSETAKASLVVGVVNDTGALVATGAAEAGAAPEGFDPKAAQAAGGTGALLDVGGQSHLFFSVPLVVSDKNEVKTAGAAFAGLPLARDAQAIVDAVAKEHGLTAVALVQGGKIVASSGAQKAQAAEALKALQANQTAPVSRGTLLELGPLKLPLMTGEGGSVLDVGSRRELAGTPFEVVAVGTIRPAIEGLANYQKTALFMLAGLLLAAVAFTVLIGGAAAAEEEAFVPAQKKGVVAPAPSKPPAPPEPAKTEPPAPLPIADAAAGPEASPDDFEFGPPSTGSTGSQPAFSAPPLSTAQQPAYNPPPVAEPAPEPEPEPDPFASLGPPTPLPAAAPPPAAKPPPPTYSLGDDSDEPKTSAYPAHMNPANLSAAVTGQNQALDPFAMAAGQLSDSEQHQDDNPEATRVAAIPAELLAASQRQNTSERAAVQPRSVPPPAMPRVSSVPSVSSEDAHFQDVFKDFVATREKCGEPADGLTFEKFVVKLRKNKEQLVQKYNCKTVRFQVYVKDGKAALKATPVKE